MRNPAPINHFPPTLFSPNRSPTYGEAHLFSQPASRLVTSCRWLTNALQLHLSGEIGWVFELYTSTNLTDWALLATLTNQSGQVLYTDPITTNRPMRFYRVVQLP